MKGHISIMKSIRNQALAVAAGIALVSGAAWRSAVANAQTSPHAPAAAVATPIQHAVAGGRDSYADVVKVVAPAVVTIRTEGRAKISPTQFEGGDDLLRRFFGDQFGDESGRGQRRSRAPKQRALGSGVIVSTDGYILTNNHVVDGAEHVKVDLTDGRTVDAKIVGTDKPSDLALLKVTASDLHPLALGNSDNVQVGDVVLAVGNPLGIGQTVTMGIISAKGRSTAAGDGSYEDFLQTDAPINHGNSGGALVNTKGELVGINSQILSNGEDGGNIGIGFAIPVNMAQHVMGDLRKDGRVHRAQLGVTVQGITSDMAASLGLKNTHGAIVSSVASGSAAERAGIKQGDIIESFNDQPVNDTNSLRNHVADAAPGSTASVVLLRNGSEQKLSLKLDEASADKTARDRNNDGSSNDDRAALGISVTPLTPEVASRLGTKDDKGLLIQDVNPDGRAADAGLQAGDVIKQVNRRTVQTVEELRAAVKDAGEKPVLLLINRHGADIFVTVRPDNG
jgi:Do/DeqQ family serine protease